MRLLKTALIFLVFILPGCCAMSWGQKPDESDSQLTYAIENEYVSLFLNSTGEAKVVFHGINGEFAYHFRSDSREIRVLSMAIEAAVSNDIRIVDRPPEASRFATSSLRVEVDGRSKTIVLTNDIIHQSAFWQSIDAVLRDLSFMDLAKIVNDYYVGQAYLSQGEIDHAIELIDGAARAGQEWASTHSVKYGRGVWEPENAYGYAYPSKTNPNITYENGSTAIEARKLPDADQDSMLKVAQYRWQHFMGDHLDIKRVEHGMDVAFRKDVARFWGVMSE